ncbi:hypothetical protein B5V03_19350 [Bradyrhizobium betae]|uniref:Uncharacterized protein n=1 Tax=Bradyrhizobium betae TaxID=244734 RepID=A0A4Q1V5J7_9BRAD|nr:hypothetical protein B5V03_19350 [Bradyrhizobium betae]
MRGEVGLHRRCNPGGGSLRESNSHHPRGESPSPRPSPRKRGEGEEITPARPSGQSFRPSPAPA